LDNFSKLFFPHIGQSFRVRGILQTDCNLLKHQYKMRPAKGSLSPEGPLQRRGQRRFPYSPLGK
jgi:hypothetical protein